MPSLHSQEAITWKRRQDSNPRWLDSTDSTADLSTASAGELGRSRNKRI